MHKGKGYTGINRRDFLKVGLAGTTSALLGWEGLADAMQYASAGSFVFPAPVYRTLGRTGLKITIISFGAMLTPEPEVMKIAFDHGVNYVDTARRYMGGKNEEIVGKALKGRRDQALLSVKFGALRDPAGNINPTLRYTYKGQSLYKLIGLVDDKKGGFNVARAKKGYKIRFICRDGYKPEISSKRIIGKKKWIIAKRKAGKLLPGGEAPFRFVGSFIKPFNGKLSAYGIIRIRLIF